MTVGPGKYDHLCTTVREKAQAQVAIIIVIDGNKGSGFSCQATPLVMVDVPQVLEKLAADIRADLKRAQ
jgi:hypothetical protein